MANNRNLNNLSNSFNATQVRLLGTLMRCATLGQSLPAEVMRNPEFSVLYGKIMRMEDRVKQKQILVDLPINEVEPFAKTA